MSKISKSFLIGSLILLLSAFVPAERSHAAIFDGSTFGDDEVRYGLCLENDAANKYPDECGNVDCSDEVSLSASEAVQILCTPESAAGTTFAKDSLSSSGITHTDNFGDFVKKMVNFSLPYLTLAAFLGYVVAGFMYVTAFGNDEQLTKAKKILVWSTVGLILVILSFAITQLFTGDLVEGLNG